LAQRGAQAALPGIRCGIDTFAFDGIILVWTWTLKDLNHEVKGGGFQMRAICCFSLMALLLALSGCTDLLSVHPAGTVETAVFDASFAGQWFHTDEDGVTVAWIRPGAPAAKDYDILWIPAKPDEAPLRLNGRLVNIGGRLIFDLVKTERPEMGVSGHFFMLVERKGDELRLGWLDSEWLRGRVTQAGGPAHLLLDSKPVITAGPAETLAFLGKYALDPKAVSDWIALKRPKAA